MRWSVIDIAPQRPHPARASEPVSTRPIPFGRTSSHPEGPPRGQLGACEQEDWLICSLLPGGAGSAAPKCTVSFPLKR